MAIWLVRHGETEWSISGQHTGSTDIPLTPDGELQAVALESARTIDRLRLQGSLTGEEAAARLRTVNEWLDVKDMYASAEMTLEIMRLNGERASNG